MSKAKHPNAVVPVVSQPLWFWESGTKRVEAEGNKSVQPEAATVVYVRDERCVDVHVLNSKGVGRAVLAAQLVLPDDPWNETTGPHCQVIGV